MDVTTMMDIFTSYGFETDDEMTDDRKIEALNDCYQEICQRQKWPFLEDWQGATIDTGGRVTINNNKVWRQINAIWFDSGTLAGRVLQPTRLDDFGQQQPTIFDTNADPIWYYYIGHALYIAPVPATDPGGMNVAFIQEPLDLTESSLSADILIPAKYHRSALVMGTLSRLALMQDDIDMSNAYERLYEKSMAFMVEEFDRQSDRTDYIHVNDSDNWDYS